MIDKNKQYRTRDGREVRIYAVDGQGECPIHGAVKNPTGWYPLIWYPDGNFAATKIEKFGQDLIEVKPRIKREVWVNVYPSRVGVYNFDCKKAADAHDSGSRIACVRLTIDCEEGEGL